MAQTLRRRKAMRPEARDLHGNAPDTCEAALVMIDVINDLEFGDGRKLLRYALPMAMKVCRLQKPRKDAGMPTIYVNDNFGRWQSNFQALLEHCLDDGVRGEAVVEKLVPDDDDYFVLKPKHSGFFSTTLDTLLRYLGTKRIILTGIATNICVLFTANDAYMRDFEIFIPSDCVASNTVEENRWALRQMKTILKADVRPSTKLRSHVLKGKRRKF